MGYQRHLSGASGKEAQGSCLWLDAVGAGCDAWGGTGHLVTVTAQRQSLHSRDARPEREKGRTQVLDRTPEFVIPGPALLWELL